MVASSRKLQSIGMPDHQLDPRAAMKKSKQASKTSPYEKPLTLVEYTGRAIARGPHVASPKKMPAGIRKEGGGSSSSGDKVSSSANRHRQFLDKTMSAVHEQLESPALADAMLRSPDEDGARDTNRWEDATVGSVTRGVWKRSPCSYEGMHLSAQSKAFQQS